jgi:hypothetical protein
MEAICASRHLGNGQSSEEETVLFEEVHETQL